MKSYYRAISRKKLIEEKVNSSIVMITIIIIIYFGETIIW